MTLRPLQNKIWELRQLPWSSHTELLNQRSVERVGVPRSHENGSQARGLRHLRKNAEKQLWIERREHVNMHVTPIEGKSIPSHGAVVWLEGAKNRQLGGLC
jgi:hypothetical protein